MAQTFDIRFARSAGLAAMLEAPSNSFHWTGNGSLSIDAQGISVAVKRGLLSLLAGSRMRRIPAADLKEVFREGEALRVEFATDTTTRASLRFWANDRDTAAHIVRLLPTSRTVELEDNAAAGGYRFNRRIAAALGLVLAVIAGTIFAISRGHPSQTASLTPVGGQNVAVSGPAPLPAAVTPAPEVLATSPAVAYAAGAPRTAIEPAAYSPDAAAGAGRTAPAAESTADNDPAATEPGLAEIELRPELPGSELSPVVPTISAPPLLPPGLATADPNVKPLPYGTLSYKRALRQLAVFGSESDDLLAAYDDYLNRFHIGQYGLLEFTMRLANLEKRWWDVTYRIQETEDFADPLLADLRATLLACVRERREFLAAFSKGTSARDQKIIASAQDHQARAVELDQRARHFVD